MDCRPSVVLMIRVTSSFLIMSTTCGRPSVTLFTRRTGRPAASMTRAVPAVATTSKPSATRSPATWAANGLSSSRTLMKAQPAVGRISLAPN